MPGARAVVRRAALVTAQVDTAPCQGSALPGAAQPEEATQTGPQSPEPYALKTLSTSLQLQAHREK